MFFAIHFDKFVCIDMDYNLVFILKADRTKDEICSCSRFIMDAKKQSGENYRPETLYELVF